MVGCWPGREFTSNSFPATYCDALAAAGCTVTDVADPLNLPPQRLDVLHIHWPENIFWRGGNALRLTVRTVRLLAVLERLRRSGTRLVWMVHNLQPHDLSGARARLWPLLAWWLAKSVDAVMTLSPATLPIVVAAMPRLGGKPSASPWHPPYADIRPAGDRASYRAVLDLPPAAKVFVFLGQLRPYKGVEELIAAFRASADPDYRLVIAGKPDTPGYGATIERLAAGDDRIRVQLGRLDDLAMAELATAADFIALPFRDYLHSGSIIYALSIGRPVITPVAPFADALGEAVGADWVQTYQGSLTPGALKAAVQMPGEPDLAALDTAKLGAAASALYRRLVTA